MNLANISREDSNQNHFEGWLTLIQARTHRNASGWIAYEYQFAIQCINLIAMTKKPEIYGHGYRIKVIFRDFDYEASDLNEKKV